MIALQRKKRATHICENQSCTYHRLLRAKDAGTALATDAFKRGNNVLTFGCFKK